MLTEFASFPAGIAARMQALADAGLDVNFILKVAGELGAQAGPVFADVQTLLSGGFSLIVVLDIWNRAAPIAAEIFGQLAAHAGKAA